MRTVEQCEVLLSAAVDIRDRTRLKVHYGTNSPKSLIGTETLIVSLTWSNTFMDSVSERS